MSPNRDLLGFLSDSLLGGSLLLILVSSCSTRSKKELERVGSSTVLSIVSRAAEEFADRDSNSSIVVNGGGSGVGI